MNKKQVGSTVYEKRGDDYYTVNATTDGDIVEVEQYDSIGHRHFSINFFAETAPQLVAMIQKAAGTKVEEPEYEYAMQMKNIRGEWVETDDPFIRSTTNLVVWADKESRERLVAWYQKEMGPDFRLVKRRKAGPIELA